MEGSWWCQWHAQLEFEHWVLDEPPWPKMVNFCDLLGTAYAPVSKIPSVKSFVSSPKLDLNKNMINDC